MRVAIYSWRIATNVLRTVYRDSDDLSLVTYDTFATTGPAESQPPSDISVGSACQPGTFNRYNYYPNPSPPYASFFIEPNSTYCGYIPTPCDISVSHFIVTDETDPGLNNGTINMFATSSYPITNYQLINHDGTISLSNTTGFFENLPPDTYTVYAQDSRGCSTPDQFGVVHPFTEDYTHFKYRLQFNAINSPDVWELRLLDKNNNYLKTEYPKDVEGTDSPVISRQVNSDEDKTTAIISRNLEINLIYDGLIFTTDEFTLSKERQWQVQLYRNDQVEFIGWLIADEIQDLYADPEYVFQLTATDGLPSLKGNVFGDGSGGNGYSNSQVQQYGVKGWGHLVKQCLDQLGYDYGTPKFLSSLRFNNTYSANLWANLGTWADILYDTEGVAVDTYTALDTLLRGVKLMLMQHKGQFIFVNNNDYFYATNPITNVEYQKAFYELNADFDMNVATGLDVIHPDIQFVGFDQPLIPINPVQSLNYDKAYNIKATIDFTYLALLYENPSFEIGSVEGDPPTGLEIQGTISAFAHKEPYNPDNTVPQAYLGDWVLRTSGWSNVLLDGLAFVIQNPGNIFFMADNERRVINQTAYVIDQVNKKINFSIQWRPIKYSDTEYVVPAFEFLFYPDSGGAYVMGKDGNWYVPEHNYPFFLEQLQTSDYLQWNSYSVQSALLPNSQTGHLFIAIKPPFRYQIDGTPIRNQGTTDHTIDYDQMLITVTDGNDQYSLQTGEVHTVTAVTGIPQANSKDVELKLFTYPPNKRIAGSVFNTSDYATGLVQNKWSFGLRSTDLPDRLPAAIVKAYSRNYQRPMRIFEGDVQGSYLSYYGVFILRWYESSIFMPYSIEMDIRKGTSHIVIIEISDESNQAVYNYVATYQKSARQSISN